jgi:hypothetical protein
MLLVDRHARIQITMSNAGGTHSISDYDQMLQFDLLLLDAQVVVSSLYLY